MAVFRPFPVNLSECSCLTLRINCAHCRIRFTRYDDQCSGVSWWKNSWSWSCPWNSDETLPYASAREGDFYESSWWDCSAILTWRLWCWNSQAILLDCIWFILTILCITLWLVKKTVVTTSTLNQSEAKIKPVATRSPVFSRLWGCLSCSWYEIPIFFEIVRTFFLTFDTTFPINYSHFLRVSVTLGDSLSFIL